MLRRRRESASDQEIEEYRSLLETPERYEEGFTVKTILGVLFVSLIMVPGNMYLGLMIGGSLGAAAQWATIILFAEVTKRSFTTLRRQEVYLLFYVASGLIASETGTFQGLLWNQYLVQSPAAKQFGIARLIPSWVAPQPESEAIINRTFFHRDWLAPIGLLVAGFLISRISWLCMGYTLFRMTSDYERLPYPFAPINAQGATALAEMTAGEETWRWRVFSTGAMIGLVFGTIYVALPAVTGAILPEPIQLIPIPFIDFTQMTGNFIPATPLGFTAHLGPIFTGLVMPFWAVVGAFAGVVIHTIANPFLYWNGLLPHWHQGMGTIETYFVNGIDFWMSFGIGLTVAIAIIGIYQIFAGVGAARTRGEKRKWAPPSGRGDFSVKTAILLFALATGALITIAYVLIPEKRIIGFFLFFGFIFTPLQSFINARLVGLVGQTVSIPYIREATIILSGYRGVDIWFVPFPIGNYGATAQKFREIELTGTKFTSVVKAEIFMVPVVLLTSFMYWSYIWKLAPIPSASYPYTQLMWRLQAYQACVWFTGTFRGELREERETTAWSPANLTNGSWWFWRARAIDSKEAVGPWTTVGRFYTDFEGEGIISELGEMLSSERETTDAVSPEPLAEGNAPPTAPLLGGPKDSVVVRTPTPDLTVRNASDPDGDPLEYYFEVDSDPTFTSPWKQTSRDESWLFKALKPKVIGTGLGFGLVSFILLSTLGLPILLIFGYVRSLTLIPHFIVPEIVGALLARYYFWKKYGKKQWRLYAPVLAVGFAVGMSLTGMVGVAIALIQRSVSVLVF